MTTTALVLAYGRHTDSSSDDPSTTSLSRLGLQLGLSVLGLALLIAGVVVAVRSGYWRAAARGPLSVLNRPERRVLMRQLRARHPVDIADNQRMMVLLVVATGLSRPWGYLLVACGSVTNVAAQAVGAARWPALVWVWVWVLCLALFTAASIRLLRDQGAAQRFLDRYLWSGGDSAGDGACGSGTSAVGPPR